METINVNGTEYKVKDKDNVTVKTTKDGRVFIDNQEVSAPASDEKIVHITVTGPIGRLSIEQCGQATINGSCISVKVEQGNITVNGNIQGNASCEQGDIYARSDTDTEAASGMDSHSTCSGKKEKSRKKKASETAGSADSFERQRGPSTADLKMKASGGGVNINRGKIKSGSACYMDASDGGVNINDMCGSEEEVDDCVRNAFHRTKHGSIFQVSQSGMNIAGVGGVVVCRTSTESGRPT